MHMCMCDARLTRGVMQYMLPSEEAMQELTEEEDSLKGSTKDHNALHPDLSHRLTRLFSVAEFMEKILIEILVICNNSP